MKLSERLRARRDRLYNRQDITYYSAGDADLDKEAMDALDAKDAEIITLRAEIAKLARQQEDNK